MRLQYEITLRRVCNTVAASFITLVQYHLHALDLVRLTSAIFPLLAFAAPLAGALLGVPDAAFQSCDS